MFPQIEPAERPAHRPDPAAGVVLGGAALHGARRALLHGGLPHGDRRRQEQGVAFHGQFALLSLNSTEIRLQSPYNE